MHVESFWTIPRIYLRLQEYSARLLAGMQQYSSRPDPATSSALRCKCHSIVTHQIFDKLMIGVILLDIVVVIVQMVLGSHPTVSSVFSWFS